MIKIPVYPYLLYLRPCDDLKIGASVLGLVLSLQLEDVKDYTCRRTTEVSLDVGRVGHFPDHNLFKNHYRNHETSGIHSTRVIMCGNKRNT